MPEIVKVKEVCLMLSKILILSSPSMLQKPWSDSKPIWRKHSRKPDFTLIVDGKPTVKYPPDW